VLSLQLGIKEPRIQRRIKRLSIVEVYSLAPEDVASRDGKQEERREGKGRRTHDLFSVLDFTFLWVLQRHLGTNKNVQINRREFPLGGGARFGARAKEFEGWKGVRTLSLERRREGRNEISSSSWRRPWWESRRGLSFFEKC